ncbi:MAG: aminopeptidase [Pseudomonadota bacterium]
MKLCALFASIAALQGCYYLQAAKGQWSLLRSAEPISEVIEDPDTESALRERLVLTQDALAFAHETLGLPDNGSYRRYASLDRDFLVMNVFAAPEFSLRPHTWCYPIVGCVAYRGYFNAESAEAYAARMRERGFDVHLGKTAAYSTLGKFDDPVISTMLKRSDYSLIWLLFHELTHQVIYVDGATAFNEAFASAVADEGVMRWFAQRGGGPSEASMARFRARGVAMRELLKGARAELASLYEAQTSEREKRVAKQAIFDALATDWATAELRGTAPVNNAALVAIALYDDLTPAFAHLLKDECDGQLPCLFDRVRELGALEADARDVAIRAYLPSAQ